MQACPRPPPRAGPLPTSMPRMHTRNAQHPPLGVGPPAHEPLDHAGAVALDRGQQRRAPALARRVDARAARQQQLARLLSERARARRRDVAALCKEGRAREGRRELVEAGAAVEPPPAPGHSGHRPQALAAARPIHNPLPPPVPFLHTQPASAPQLTGACGRLAPLSPLLSVTRPPPPNPLTWACGRLAPSLRPPPRRGPAAPPSWAGPGSWWPRGWPPGRSRRARRRRSRRLGVGVAWLRVGAAQNMRRSAEWAQDGTEVPQ